MIVCLALVSGCSKKNAPSGQSSDLPSGAGGIVDSKTPTPDAAPSVVAPVSSGKGSVPLSGTGQGAFVPKGAAPVPGGVSVPAVSVGSSDSKTPLAAVSPTPVAAPKIEVKAPEPECFSIAFRHKKLGGHASDEDCSHHKNLLRMKHKNINPAALCIRVNGRPVAFQPVKGAPSDFLISSIAGPQAKIIANYCIGKARCNEECKVPRDEFMEAIGGSDEESPKAGKWGAGEADARDIASAKMDAEIRKEMADIDAASDVFGDWILDAETVLSCQLKAKK